MAAKAATTTIPFVFTSGADPVQAGLVSNLNRPGGNITGVSFSSNISEAKRLGLLHAMVPGATLIGVLVNPDNASAATEVRDLNEAQMGRARRLSGDVITAINGSPLRSSRDFATTIAAMVPGTMIISVQAETGNQCESV